MPFVGVRRFLDFGGMFVNDRKSPIDVDLNVVANVDMLSLCDSGRRNQGGGGGPIEQVADVRFSTPSSAANAAHFLKSGALSIVAGDQTRSLLSTFVRGWSPGEGCLPEQTPKKLDTSHAAFFRGASSQYSLFSRLHNKRNTGWSSPKIPFTSRNLAGPNLRYSKLLEMTTVRTIIKR